jgi:hypothetical protein
LLHHLLALASGSLVGFTLGLIGGGGSILAVPLLIYVVGVASPHIAIGTSAVAVTVAAALNLFHHARAATVRWPCAAAFSVAGVLGAALGARLGQAFDGQKLLALFGALMLVVGVLMFLPRRAGDAADVHLSRANAARLLPGLFGTGFAVGGFSGFFGIGGGFLVVPGLIGATAMPILNAISSSLVSVTAFGLTTAASYAFAGLVDWPVAALFVSGAALGGYGGSRLAGRMGESRRLLQRIFAAVVVIVGLYVVTRGLLAL